MVDMGGLRKKKKPEKTKALENKKLSIEEK